MRISDWSSDVCSSDLPVVDVAVTLTDGQFHSVDSSDQAFRTAAGIAMSEGLPECAPVLLEPIRAVTFSVPNEYTAKVHAIVSARRGQNLGLAAPAGGSEERRVGTACVSTCRSWWSVVREKKKKR